MMGWLRTLLYASSITLSISSSLATDANWTSKHEAGRCAIRGQCGKKSLFGGQLPCPDNGLAQEPGDDTRTKLVAICGEKWRQGPICCDDDQVRNSRIPETDLANLCTDR
jgi:Niemann-Pick C1 protein